MAQFKEGDKVILVGTNNKGIIVSVGRAGRGGRQLYTVNFAGEESSELESNLIADYDITDPFERCINQIYGTYEEFSKTNTTFKIQNSNISTISSLKASKTLFKAYQFKPLLKFLNSDNKRLLVADEVGLGKTIEAGHIMLELKARNELRNVLLVCTLSLQEKWKAELKNKFGLSFTIYEDVATLKQQLKDNDGSIKGIINYEKIRMKKRSDDNEDEKKESLIDFITRNKKKFSLIVCDEAHKMRNSETQTYKGAELLMQCADAAIFLTATPIMISEENLYNLLHLLDNERYCNYQIFNRSLQENKPFVRALSQLNTKTPLQTIADDLKNSVINYTTVINDVVYTDSIVADEYFEEVPLYKRIIERMETEEDTMALRAELQYDILSMSQLNTIYSRTRKREVTTDWSQAERKPHTVHVTLESDEQASFNEVIENYIDDNSYSDLWGEPRMSQGASLGLVQKKRQVASSVYAFLNHERDLENGIDRYREYKDAKFEALMNIIKTVFSNGESKIIVFALFRKTLNYLQIRLRQRGINSVVIHGQVKNRDEELARFKNDPHVQVLLSSEVGSEGLDMQFCSSMVNYDLPWNPMVVEQRIGRIDRFGQESEVVNIYNIIVKDSIQEDIYTRLLERIGLFRSSLGDMEAILDAEIESSGIVGKISIQKLYTNMEKEFFCKSLTREERLRKIDEIARAIINEKEALKKIEEGLTNALTNDAYFKDEINRILNDKAYVTEKELKTYVDMVLNEHLTTCSLEYKGDYVYEFAVPKSNLNVLCNFLTKYQPSGSEADLNFGQFKDRIRGKESFLLTFNQEKAYKDRNLIFVNIYNPIILACQKYFQDNKDTTAKTFRFDIRKEEFDGLVNKGHYFLAIYQIASSRKVFGITKTTNTLFPILYDIRQQKIETNSEVTRKFFGVSQTEGRIHIIQDNEQISVDTINDMQYDMEVFVSDYRSQQLREQKIRIENDQQMQLKQTNGYFDSRKKSLDNSLAEYESKLAYAEYTGNKADIRKHENSIRLIGYQLEKLEAEKEDQVAKISQDPCLEIKKSLISINLISVV